MSEKDIENNILAYLVSIGLFVWKAESQGTYDQKLGIYRKGNAYHRKGVPDILGVLPDGRFLGIEVKSERGILSPEQRFFIDKINSLGGLAFVAKSVEDARHNLISVIEDNRKEDT